MVLFDGFFVAAKALVERRGKRVKIRIAIGRRGVPLQYGQCAGDVVALDHDAREQHGKAGVVRIGREAVLQDYRSVVDALGFEQQRDQRLARGLVTRIQREGAAKTVHPFRDPALVHQIHRAPELLLRAVLRRRVGAAVDRPRLRRFSRANRLRGDRLRR